ncbi:MAG: primase-helicase family protein [Brevinema sp.]
MDSLDGLVSNKQDLIAIQQWLTNNIFDSDGNIIYIRDDTLCLVYPHKQFKRLYTGLNTRQISLLHTHEIRRLWGRIEINDTDIATYHYTHKQNRIIEHSRHKPNWNPLTDTNHYNTDIEFFCNLLKHLCNDNQNDYYFLLHYSAFLAQKKSFKERSERIVVLHSTKQGVGKSTYCNIMRSLVNGVSHHSDVLINKFDAYQLGRRNLIVLEEGETITQKHYIALKALSTSHIVETTVKHSMKTITINSSFECIITTNRIPSILKCSTNRREVIIECLQTPPKQLFEPIHEDRQSLYANIDKFLHSFPADDIYVQTYKQKEDHQEINYDIPNFIQSLLEFQCLPIQTDAYAGSDYILIDWPEEEYDTKLLPQEFFKLFLQYCICMNTKLQYCYRYFFNEVHRILDFKTTFPTVIFPPYSRSVKAFSSIYIRSNIQHKKRTSDTFLQFIKTI